MFYQYKKDEMIQITETNFQKIKNSFDKNIQKNLQNHYIEVANKFITNDMLKAIANNDKAKLLSFSNDSYNVLRVEDAYLQQFTFYKDDGSPLLRVYNKEPFGDDISKMGMLSNDIQKKQTILCGFDIDLHGFSYKIFIPLFYQEKYIGRFELGISPKKIINLVTFFNQIDALIQVNTDSLTNKNNSIIYSKIIDSDMLRHTPNISSLPKQLNITYQEKTISISSFAINDYNNKSIGKFVFFQDLTNVQDKYSSLVQHMFLIFFTRAPNAS
jgi:methyl-accepting chemotaxis protein